MIGSDLISFVSQGSGVALRLGPLKAMPVESRRFTLSWLLMSGQINFENIGQFMALRGHMVADWDAALDAALCICPSSAEVLYAAIRCSGRKRIYCYANDLIDRYLSVAEKKLAHDTAREMLRIRMLQERAGFEQLRTSFSWDSVERSFDNQISKASYGTQIQYLGLAADGLLDGPSEYSNPAFFFKNVSGIAKRGVIAHSGDCSMLAACKKIMDADKISVVGKGTSVFESGFGERVDSADFVVRVNHFPKATEVLDLGAMTDLVFYAGHLADRFGENIAASGFDSPLMVLLSHYRGSYNASKGTYATLEDELCHLIECVSYRRATTGLRALLLVSFLAKGSAEVTLYGFDFYSDDPNKAALNHELEYERFFAREFLPAAANVTVV